MLCTLSICFNLIIMYHSSQSNVPGCLQGTVAAVQALADGLKLLVRHGHTGAASALARCLPYLAAGSSEASHTLLEHFATSLDMSALDNAAATGDATAHQVSALQLTHP